MRRILTILGTRPEAIKLAPLLKELERSAGVDSQVCVTAQHRELLDEVLSLHEIVPTHDLDVMSANQQLAGLTARLLDGLDAVLERSQPDTVVVQGDTTTTYVAALAAFYRRIPVAHVEAGLRTGRKGHPFPEEANRRMTSCVADLHFAPTEAARDALVAEGHAGVHLVGNTIVEAVREMAERVTDAPLDGLGLTDPVQEVLRSRRRLVAVTCHRRESFGAGVTQVARALTELATANPEITLVLPLHPNPNVRTPLEERLTGIPNLHLSPALRYPAFVRLLLASELVLTDSGGVQEECASLGIPFLVLREVTERPEALSAGLGELVGTDPERIVGAATARLASPTPTGVPRIPDTSPVGDGHASERIAELLGA